MPVRRWPKHVIKTLRLTLQQGWQRRDLEIEALFCRPVGAHRRAVFRAMQGAAPSTLCRVTTTPLPHGGCGVLVFGGYFPVRVALQPDVPVLFRKNTGSRKYGKKPMEEVEGVEPGLGAGRLEPIVNFATREAIQSRWPIFSRASVFYLPTAGKFSSRFGVVPVTLALGRRRSGRCRPGRTGRDWAWSGITEDYNRRLGGCEQLLSDQTYFPAPGAARNFATKLNGMLSGAPQDAWFKPLHWTLQTITATTVLGWRSPTCA